VIEGEVDHRQRTTGENVLDMSEWMSRVALETVGQAILGYSFDPLDSPHNNPYTSAVKELMYASSSYNIYVLNGDTFFCCCSPTIFSLSLVRQFAPFLSKLGPASFRRKLVEWTPNRAVQKVKNMSDVMHDTAVGILRQKRKEIAREVEDAGDSFLSRPKDIISILREHEFYIGMQTDSRRIFIVRANEKAIDDEKLSEAELTGQMT